MERTGRAPLPAGGRPRRPPRRARQVPDVPAESGPAARGQEKPAVRRPGFHRRATVLRGAGPRHPQAGSGAEFRARRLRGAGQRLRFRRPARAAGGTVPGPLLQRAPALPAGPGGGRLGVVRETLQHRQARAAAILRRLKKEYPDAKCELDWSTPLELAVATILSAQCTDKRVNLVTPALFKKYRSAQDWAATPPATLEKEFHSTGFFRNKAKNVRALMARLDAEFGGDLPGDFDVLVSLPGIGRKTANLLVATVFGKPGLVVDTHFIRLSNRLGFVKNETDATKIERELAKIVPPKDWTAWSHAMVWHGRRRCMARKPDCANCPLADLCPAAGNAAAK
ncbi:MAG: endonuclease III [Spartobacteria bacterium]|nr:endonuclease III [Spartobacteria bacterium]